MDVLREVEIGAIRVSRRRPGRYESVTSAVCGDPLPERSALAARLAGRAGSNGVPAGKLCRVDVIMKRVIPAEGRAVEIASPSVLRVLELAADGRRRRLDDMRRHFKCGDVASALRRANADLVWAGLRFVTGCGLYWLEAM